MRNVTFAVDQEWKQVGRLELVEGGQPIGDSGFIFSKAQARVILEKASENGDASTERINQLREEVTSSELPEDLGLIAFVECQLCKGHGWLVVVGWRSVEVTFKSVARESVENYFIQIGGSAEDKAKVLAQIEASQMPEDEIFLSDPIAEMMARIGRKIKSE